MSKVIRVADSTFSRLQLLAIPLVDTPASVIDRLLDYYESQPEGSVQKIKSEPTKELFSREPRQRGVVVKVDGKVFKADSLSNLYNQVLRFLCDSGQIDKIRKHLPIATSAQRYLIANKPIHPNGKDFFAPVEYGGFYMEAHKDYKNGIRHLKDMLALCGLSLNYIE